MATHCKETLDMFPDEDLSGSFTHPYRLSDNDLKRLSIDYCYGLIDISEIRALGLSFAPTIVPEPVVLEKSL